jgi:hypothetical protein
MERHLFRAACTIVLVLGWALIPAKHIAQDVRSVELTVSQQDALIKKYCVVCHNDVLLVGGMSLEHVDPANPDPAIAGMMAGKIDGGAMGASGVDKPDRALGVALSRALRAKSTGAEASTGGWAMRVDPLVATIKVKGTSTANSQPPGTYTLSMTCSKNSAMSSHVLLSVSHPSTMHLTADRPMPEAGSLSFAYEVDGAATPQTSDRANFVLPLPERTLTIRNLFPGESVTFPFDGLNPEFRRIFSTCLPGTTERQ